MNCISFIQQLELLATNVADIWQCKKAIATLENYAVLSVTGPDAAKFLQGQITINAEDLAIGESRIAAHCDPKGRAHATFVIFRLSTDSYLLCLPDSALPLLEKSLSKYAVFSKATISNVSKDIVIVAGAGAAECLFELDACYTHEFTDYLTLTICPVIDDKEAEAVLDKIEALVNEEIDLFIQSNVIANWWNSQLIKSKIALIESKSSLQHIPNVLGFEDNDGIDFNKGCYTGQEVIARLHYRGQAKRSLAMFKCHSAQAIVPQISEWVGASISRDNKNIGDCILLATTDSSIVMILAEAKTDSLPNKGEAITLTQQDNTVSLQVEQCK